VNARAVRLLDQPDLLRELRGLERRRGVSGRDRVDHRPGAHDDLAVAAAGVLSALVKASEPTIAYILPRDVGGTFRPPADMPGAAGVGEWRHGRYYPRAWLDAQQRRAAAMTTADTGDASEKRSLGL
jgi:hypothetical protein